MSFWLRPPHVSSSSEVDIFGTYQVISSRVDVASNLFLNPPETGSSGPDNSEWIIGTTQHVRWSTDMEKFDFLLYQQLGCGDHSCVNGPFLIAENLTSETKTWDWQVTTGTLTLNPTNTFFLRMRDSDGSKIEFDSNTLSFTLSQQPGGGASLSSKPSASAGTAKSSSITAAVTSTRATQTTLSSSKSAFIAPGSTNSVQSIIPVSTKSVQSFIPSITVGGPTSSATSTTTATALPATSPEGISMPAKVGMIVSAISLAVIAISVGWYLGRRRKLKSKKSPFHAFEPQAHTPTVQLSELHVPGWGEQKPIPPPFTPRELHGKGKFDSFTGVMELEAREKPGELGSGWRSGVKSGIHELGPRYT